MKLILIILFENLQPYAVKVPVKVPYAVPVAQPVVVDQYSAPIAYSGYSGYSSYSGW